MWSQLCIFYLIWTAGCHFIIVFQSCRFQKKHNRPIKVAISWRFQIMSDWIRAINSLEILDFLWRTKILLLITILMHQTIAWGSIGWAGQKLWYVPNSSQNNPDVILDLFPHTMSCKQQDAVPMITTIKTDASQQTTQQSIPLISFSNISAN